MSHKPEYFANEIIGFGGTGPTGPTGATGATGSSAGPTGPRGNPFDFGTDDVQVFMAESSQTGFGATADIDWDTVIKNDSHYTLDNSDTRITFNESGAYQIRYYMGTRNLSSVQSKSPFYYFASHIPDGTGRTNQCAPATRVNIYNTENQVVMDTFVAQIGEGEKFSMYQGSTDSDIWLNAPHSICIEYVGTFAPQFSSILFASFDFVDSDDVSRVFSVANAWSVAAWARPGDVTTNFTDWCDIARTNGGVLLRRNGPDIQLQATGTGGTKRWDWLNVLNQFEDEWVHVVGTWDGNELRCYRNGVDMGEPDAKPFDNTIVGVDNAGNVKFEENGNGYIHSVILWDKKLEQVEIASLYNNGRGVEVDPMHEYGNYSSHANVQHYWRFGWMAPNPVLNGILGGKDCGLADPQVHPTDYGDFNDMGAGNISTSVFPGDVIYDPPASTAQTHSYYKNDNTDLFRSFDSSLGFSNAFTLGFWYRPENNTETDMIHQSRSFGAVNTSRIDVEAQGAASNGRVGIALYDSSGTLFKDQAWNSILAGNTWVHIMIRWDGTTLSFFKDGVDQGSPDVNTTDNAGTMDDPGDRQNSFGGDTTSGNHIQGWYHSYHAWSEALSDSVIATIYNGGDGSLDLSVNDTTNPSASSWDFNDLAADDQYVQCDTTMSTLLGATPNSFSFMGWINPSNQHTSDDSIWGSASDWNNWDDGFGLQFTAANGRDIRFWVDNYITGGRVDATIPAATGEWVHIAGAYDGSAGEMTLWVNGVATKTTTGVPATITSAGNIRVASIGNANQLNQFFRGSIDEFTFYTDVITNGEVRYMYENGSNQDNINAPTNDVIWWRFGDVSADDPTASTGTVTDQSNAGTNDGTPQAAGGTIDAIAGSYNASGTIVQWQQMGPNADDVVISQIGDDLDGDSLSLSNAQNQTEIPT